MDSKYLVKFSLQGRVALASSGVNAKSFFKRPRIGMQRTPELSKRERNWLSATDAWSDRGSVMKSSLRHKNVGSNPPMAKWRAYELRALF